MNDPSKLSDAQLLALLNGAPPQPPAGPPGTFGHAVSPNGSVEAWIGGDPAAATPAPPQPAPGGPALSPEQQIGQSIDNHARAVARGFPVLGAWADEANAATAAGIAPTLEPMLRHAPHFVQALAGYDQGSEIGDLPTFKARYDAAQNLQRQRDHSYDEAHPRLSMAEQIAGGVVPTVMLGLTAPGMIAPATTAAGPEAGLLARSAAGALEGAAIGGAHGYGMGYGALDDPSRLQSAGGAAMFGGAAGLALPVATTLGGIAWRNTGGRLVDALRGSKTVQAPVESDAQRIARVLRGEGTGSTAAEPAAAAQPQAVTDAQRLGQAAAGGPPPKASPMKPDRADLESGLVTAQRPEITVPASNVDDAYVRLARAVKRQKMAPEDAAARTQELGPFGTLADTGESTRDLLRASINRPGRGATIAQENLTPRQNGVFDAHTGEWTVRPSSTRILDDAQSGLGLAGKDYHGEVETILAGRKAAAGPAYAKAYEAPPVASSELAEFAAAPDFADAYGRARAISQKEFVKLPDGTEKIVPLPEKMPDQLDWRTLDLMKQGLDDTISEAKRTGIGGNSQGASKGYLRRFVDKLDSLNPDYKAARDAFAGPTAMKDALEEGRGLLSEDAPVVAANLAEKSEAERQMMRLGALQALKTKLGNANVTFDAANQAGFLKPNQLARFKALFPDRQSFADFYRTMANEKTMHATSGAAFGNSTTTKQLLNVMEPNDPQIEGMTQAVPAAASGNIVALVRAIHRMGMESPMREGVAETIASVLSSHNHEQLPEIVRRLTEAQRRAEVIDLVRTTTAAGAGNVAGHATQPRQ